MIDQVRGCDGANDLVAAVAERGWAVALASSGAPAYVDYDLDQLDLRELAGDWTTASDVSNTKPDPDLLHTTLERVGGGPAVLIGDSTWDRVAADRAGLLCVGLLTGGVAEAELREAGAAVVFEDLPGLQWALDSVPFSSR